MAFKSAVCPGCGGALMVDSETSMWFCHHCKTFVVTEQAINNYNITNHNNIRADVVNIYSSENSDFVIRGGVLEKYNGSATEVVIPDSVTHIGDSAFAGCAGITSVVIPNSVREIHAKAFSGCTSLPSINIPDSVAVIGESAFSSCKRLTSIVIPNSVKEIGAFAFSYCISLTSVTIPGSIKTISNSTFKGCSALASIFIPDGVSVLGDYAFESCINLISVRLPNNIKFGENNYTYGLPFYNCPKLLDVKYAHVFAHLEQFPEILKIVTERRKNYRCQHCGGKFSFLDNCKTCGKKKDY